MKNLIAIIFILLISGFAVNGQIQTTIINNSVKAKDGKIPFFTNRPLVIEEDGSISFRNSSTKQTNSLHFCNYNFITDSIEVNYHVVNLSDHYPTGKVEHNVFYDIYEYYRLERGIKNYYFVVGGYGKSFQKQIHSYLKRLKEKYGDELFGKAVVSVFAWGAEEDVYQYYNAVRKSKHGAGDFAIFQHLLDEFMSDSVYFETHPNDLTIDILFSSMGNNLFKEYIERREEQNIPLKRVYNRIIFTGSVAPRNAFEEGKAFHDLYQMTDTVDVYVNSKDILLKLSSIAQLSGRMGNKGPRNPEELPGYIKVIDLTYLITKEDMAKMGHDYLLTNPVLQEHILQDINSNIDMKEEPVK